MFDWKKSCFIWLCLMSFPLWSSYFQSPTAYYVCAPSVMAHQHETNFGWEDDPAQVHEYLRDPPGSCESTEWTFWILNHRIHGALCRVCILPPGVSALVFDRWPASENVAAESYGNPSNGSGDPFVLALGGWRGHLDSFFRFLSINLEDFKNLQAIGRNAFEDLGHQPYTVTEITVPDKCNQIEEFAWKNCDRLKKVTFLCPDIIYISPLAFDGCYDSLEEVRIATNMTNSVLNIKVNRVNALINEKNLDITSLKDDDRIELYDSEKTGPHLINSVADFVATFEAHGYTYSFEPSEDSDCPDFIVLTKSKLPTTSKSIDIADKPDSVVRSLLYNGEELALLTDNLKVKTSDGTELPTTKYEIYLRWIKQETQENSGWVKYKNKYTLKVRDPGVYTIEYVINYTGNDTVYKSYPENLEIEQDEIGGYLVKIAGEEV